MPMFGKPSMLLWLLLLPVCGLFLSLAWHRKQSALARLGNIVLVQRLIASTSVARQITRRGLVLAALLFVILALAHPRWGNREREVVRRGVDVIVAIDTSKSMLADDTRPTRLEKAKASVRGLIGRLEGDRIGVICFAGDAVVQCPLTLDYGAARILLDSVDVTTVARGGTNLAEALTQAKRSFVSEEQKYKILILLTDGESTEGDPGGVAAELAEAGVRVFPIGIGDPRGTLIPITDERGQTRYLQNAEGETVKSSLDEAMLQAIARVTGGEYHRSTAGEFELDRIYDSIRQEEEKELTSQMFSQRIERYRWFLAVALLLLVVEMLLSERRSPAAREVEQHA